MASGAISSGAISSGAISSRATHSGRLTEHVNCLSWDCGLRNLAYCLVEYVDNERREFQIRLWENFSLNATDLREAVEALQRELDARPWMLHVDHVAIEAQTIANPTMKVVSHALQMYFLARLNPVPGDRSYGSEALEGRTPTQPPLKIHFVSPKSKFKVTSVPEPEGAKGHAKNKKVAILMAKKVLQDQGDRASFDYLMSHRKKDDLSDSLLQGIYILRVIKRKVRTSKKILDYILSGSDTEAKYGIGAASAKKEIDLTPQTQTQTQPGADSENGVIDETSREGEVVQQAVYHSDGFDVPLFDVDGTSVHRGTCYMRSSRLSR